MAIYKMQIGNPRDGFDWVYEVFNNQEEISQYKKKNQVDGDKIYGLKKVDNLADILSDPLENDEIVIMKLYEILCEKLGKFCIDNTFPDEEMNDDLIEKVRQMVEIKTGELLEDWHESEKSKRYDGGIDWDQAGEDEIKRMDDETDGHWRSANDFG